MIGLAIMIVVFVDHPVFKQGRGVDACATIIPPKLGMIVACGARYCRRMSGLFAGTSLERPVTCERCGKPHGQCACPRGRDGKVLDPRDQPVRVRREKRRGKLVTVVAGLAPRSEKTNDLPAMLAQLKKRFAAGGAIVDGEMELQGDHRDGVVEWFVAQGYSAKASGG
jgi:translation initiation factor 1